MKQQEISVPQTVSLSALQQELAEARAALKEKAYLYPVERHKIIAKIRLIKSTIEMLEHYKTIKD